MAIGTAIAERFGLAPASNVQMLSEQLDQARNNNGLLQESLTQLEQQLNEPGWIRFTQLAEQEFTADGLRQLRAICRLMNLKSPLIKRGLNLRSAYVWGQGVEITARANGTDRDGEQDVQAVVAGFLDDAGNQRAATDPAARDRLEHELGTDGELFLTLFTRPMTGQVQVRVILADEITDVITNPEDRSEPWYYRRRWVRRTVDPATGSVSEEQVERLYPCVDYRPAVRPKRFGLVDVAWDSPVLHVAVNRPEGWRRGIPDAYAAIDWARAYKEFLEDWARLTKSLSRFAWRLTAKGNTKAQAQARLAQAPTRDPSTGRALDVGATAITPTDATLEAIPKSGATIDAESGRPLAMMVAAALDVPVTMLLSDPGQTGARATAETLDRPTELAMGQRRDLWASAYQRMLRYVITEAVRAPQGLLKGVIKRDSWTGQETVTLAGDTDQTIDIVFPDLDDADVGVIVEAIKKAADTGTVPPEQILRLLLSALGVRDVDSILEKMVGDDGEFLWPAGPPLGAGQQAVDQLRAGQDPAAADPGLMAPDDEPPADEPADDQPPEGEGDG